MNLLLPLFSFGCSETAGADTDDDGIVVVVAEGLDAVRTSDKEYSTISSCTT